MTTQGGLPGIRIAFLILMALTGLVTCKGPAEKEVHSPAPQPREDELFRVGSLIVYEADLALRLEERYGGRSDEQTRQIALDDLVERARFAQAALDAGLADDAIIREEVSRLLEARLRETELADALRQTPDIPEVRLRELYKAQIARFQSPEKRQVAALWLDSGPDPQRAKRYAERLTKARDFALQNSDIADHPEKGFSVLGADYSEHSASRFRGGMIGWMEAKGGLDQWSKAVAEIAFALQTKGEISEVITRPEGVFLVRVTDVKPTVLRPFESVAAELERAERSRLHKELETKFEQRIETAYPVEWPPD